MIYDSPETIPAKVYYKILDTGKLRLLTDDPNIKEEELKLVWDKIEEEYSSINKHVSKELKKVIDISKQIESLECKLQFVNLAVYYLRHVKDDELIDKLKSYGYSFKWVKPEKDTEITEAIYQADLDRVDRESEALTIKIGRLQLSMPKANKNESDEVPFDETVLMYAAFTGLGYVDPNSLPLTQYDAMIISGNKKMKALESQTTPKNK